MTKPDPADQLRIEGLREQLKFFREKYDRAEQRWQRLQLSEDDETKIMCRRLIQSKIEQLEQLGVRNP